MSNSKGHERRWGLFHLLSATATSHPSSTTPSEISSHIAHESSLLIPIVVVGV